MHADPTSYLSSTGSGKLNTVLINETKTSIDVLNALDLHPAGSGNRSQKKELFKKLKAKGRSDTRTYLGVATCLGTGSSEMAESKYKRETPSGREIRLASRSM